MTLKLARSSLGMTGERLTSVVFMNLLNSSVADVHELSSLFHGNFEVLAGNVSLRAGLNLSWDSPPPLKI